MAQSINPTKRHDSAFASSLREHQPNIRSEPQHEKHGHMLPPAVRHVVHDDEEDYLMSDDFDDSCVIELVKAKDVTSAESTSGSMAIDRFIDRPASAGNDLDAAFCMAPKHAVRKALPARHTQVPLFACPKQSSDEVASVTWSYNSAQSNAAEADASHITIDNNCHGAIDAFQPLPRESSQSATKWPSSQADNTKDLSEGISNGDNSDSSLQKPQTPNKSTAKSSSNSECMPELVEGPYMLAKENSAHQKRLLDVNQPTARQQNDAVHSSTDTTLADIPVPQEVVLKEQELVRRSTEHHHSRQLAPVHDHYRVIKSYPTHQQVRKHRDDNTHSSPARACSQPGSKSATEEDLIMLLIHRSRNKDLKAKQDCQQIQALEKTREALQREIDVMKEETESLQAERGSAEAECEAIQIELDTFKNKYKKLKNWALEMNKEYATIRQEGEHLKSSISTLRKQGQELIEPLRSAIATNTDAILAVDSVKSQLKETQQSLTMQQAVVQDTKVLLAEKDVELRMLKLKEQEHGSLATDAFKVLRGLEKSIKLQQTHSTKALKAFSVTLENFHAESTHSDKLQEHIRAIKEVSAQIVTTNSDVGAVNSAITGLAKQLDSIEESLRNGDQAENESTLSASLSRNLSSITEKLQGLKPDIVQLGVLQQANAMLQERTKGDAAIRQIIEDAKRIAEVRAAEVQTNNNKLIESIALIKDNEGKRCAQNASELHSQVSTITAECSRVTEELAKAKTTLESSQNEVFRLRENLKSSKSHLTDEISAMQAMHDRHVSSLKADFHTQCDQMNAEHQKQLTKKDAMLGVATKTSEDISNHLKASQDEVRHLISNEQKQVQTIQLLQNQAKQQSQDLERQIQSYNKLRDDFRAVNSAANRTSVLEHESAEKDLVIRDLRMETKKIHDLRSEIEQLKQQRNTKDAVIDQLKRDLANSEVSANEQISLERSKGIDMERLLAEAKQQVADQRDKLFFIEEQTRVCDNLKEANLLKDNDIERLQSLLEDAQSTNKKLRASDGRRESLEQQIIQLQQRETKLCDLEQQVVELERSNSVKDGRIASQERMLTSMGQLDADIQVMRRQLSEKDTQLLAKDNEIRELKAQCISVSDFHYTRSPDLDGMFTQNTDLSMPERTDLGEHQITPDSSQPSHISDTQESGQPETINHQMTIRSTFLENIASTDRADVERLSRPSIIPDSQVHNIGHRASCTMSTRRQRTSSPLSDVDEDLFEQGFKIDVQHSTTELHQEDRSESSSDTGDHIFDVMATPPQKLVRHKNGRSLARRPSSIASQESMLLQAPETGYSHSPRTYKTQHTNAGIRSARSQAGLLQAQEQQRSGPARNPRVTNGILQSDTNMASTVQAEPRSGGLANILRESIRPNSAVKRSNDQYVAADIQERSVSKRLKTAISRSFNQVQRGSIMTSPTSSANGHADGKRGDNLTIDQPSFKKPAKKTSSYRTRSQQDKYADRFGGSSQ